MDAKTPDSSTVSITFFVRLLELSRSFEQSPVSGLLTRFINRISQKKNLDATNGANMRSVLRYVVLIETEHPVSLSVMLDEYVRLFCRKKFAWLFPDATCQLLDIASKAEWSFQARCEFMLRVLEVMNHLDQ